MAKSIQQAEAELRTAALEYVEGYEAYSRIFDKNGDHIRPKDAPLHPETLAACLVSNEKQAAMFAAAYALHAAIAGQRRAEAL